MSIAKIKLAQGQCGFYDEISGVHLTLNDTESEITKGTNTVGLLNAIACGKIIVVEGSLGEDSHGISKEDVIPAIPTYYRLLEKKKKLDLKSRLVRDLTSVTSFVEDIKEDIKEEAVEVEETATKKKATKKKTTKIEKDSIEVEEAK